MKVAIPVVFLALCGLTLCLRKAVAGPEAGTPAAAGRTIGRPASGSIPAAERSSMPSRSEASAEPVVRVAEAKPRPLTAATVGRAPDSRARLSAQLTKGLGLSELQRPMVDRILLEREEEIQAWHQGIRKSGIFDVREYEWRIEVLETGYYKRIDAVLESKQRPPLAALAEAGLFKDGLNFEIEPGMVVLE